MATREDSLSNRQWLADIIAGELPGGPPRAKTAWTPSSCSIIQCAKTLALISQLQRFPDVCVSKSRTVAANGWRQPCRARTRLGKATVCIFASAESKSNPSNSIAPNQAICALDSLAAGLRPMESSFLSWLPNATPQGHCNRNACLMPCIKTRPPIHALVPLTL